MMKRRASSTAFKQPIAASAFSVNSLHHQLASRLGRRWLKLGALLLVASAWLVIIYSAQAAGPQTNTPLSTEQAGKLFREKVHPVLQEKCLACHSGQVISSGLDLQSRASLLKGGRRGPALVPGSPAQSWLYRAIKGQGDLQMPLGQPLPAEIITAIRQWIEAGAPWPTKDSTEATAAARQPKDRPEDVWAFQPVKRWPVPSPGIAAALVQTPVDAFILQKLKQQGLTPAPVADRRTLIRRATFDLTGLPPTPEEVTAFLRDPAPTPKAFETVVERLLASPRYGERWGRHWLDVVRYADTGGGSNDWERPNAWRYRDYVIRSFNQDKPYDQFILEQLAGDELDSTNAEKLIATGFLRMGPWEHTGMSVEAVTRRLYGIGEPETDLFGRRCLLARRLVEKGVRFVQVYSSGWDSHDDIATAHANRMRAVDKPIAGLLTDLKRRGLLDSTLVVWGGEFGRSPDNGIRSGGLAYGRDHNPKAMTMWFAGGDVKAGQIVGATDEIGQTAVEVVHPLRDLHVTLLRLLGLDDDRLRYFHNGRYMQLSQFGGQVIKEILA